jgi:hypothetical protein
MYSRQDNHSELWGVLHIFSLLYLTLRQKGMSVSLYKYYLIMYSQPDNYFVLSELLHIFSLLYLTPRQKGMSVSRYPLLLDSLGLA